MQDKQENSSCSASGHHPQEVTHFLLECPSSDAPSLTLLLPFLTSGLNLGVWPNCWVFAEFLSAPFPRKGLDSTTTTTKKSEMWSTKNNSLTINQSAFPLRNPGYAGGSWRFAGRVPITVEIFTPFPKNITF